MKRAKIVLGMVAVLAIVGGLFAFKANRNAFLFYKVDSANADPAKRVCTSAVFTRYTTIEADAIEDAPTLIQTTYYTTSVNSTVCPVTTIWSHL